MAGEFLPLWMLHKGMQISSYLSPEELLGVFLTEGTLGSTSFAAGDSLSFGSRRRRLIGAHAYLHIKSSRGQGSKMNRNIRENALILTVALRWVIILSVVSNNNYEHFQSYKKCGLSSETASHTSPVV